MTNTLILCDCSQSMPLDADELGQKTAHNATKCHSALCTKEISALSKAMQLENPQICCTQESAVFEALAEELGQPIPPMIDLRDRAGWSKDPRSKLPKMAALVAEANLPTPAQKTLDVSSNGACLILGGAAALEAATQLSAFLAVTLLLNDDTDLPVTRSFDVIRGKLTSATGSLGNFYIKIDAFQQVNPEGIGEITLSDPQNGARSNCDIILDLRATDPLFPAHEKRDGYLRADPKHPAALTQAILEASHLVGTFEKTIFLNVEPHLCAHSRAKKTGCHRCLDVCPTGAISPDGDHVKVDPLICAGCGACSVLCPSGAITYDAPPTQLTFQRIQTLAFAFRDAGGDTPRLLVVDAHGSEMIRLSARFDDGLPADVIPLELDALGSFGHAEMTAALAAGFHEIAILASPKLDRDTLAFEIDLASAITQRPACHVIDISDPSDLSAALTADTPPTPINTPVRPMGSRRQITRTAATALVDDQSILPLPDQAPYGAVLVNNDACTLCLSCVSLCPSGALMDNPDMPQLRFQEDACLQCGLCANVCPEQAITYEPRLNLTPSALEQVVLHEEEPFACIECGSLFGVKSTVEKITEKLAGNHSMFASNDAAKMIQMCDNCRIQAQYHANDNPFQSKPRPRVRTTEDYLSKRKDH